MSRLILIACSDDFLLEEGLREAVTGACSALGVSEPELLAADQTPENVALEVQSPSLFSPQRVLMMRDVRPWLQAPKPAAASSEGGKVDPAPLVEALADGVPEGVALVLGAWCGGKPKGPLVDVVEREGRLAWIPLPAPPKPWEDVVLSDEQRAELRRVLERAAPGVRLTRGAADLLMERLGFAPRQLAQEAAKLVAAAGEVTEVDEDLVRRLVFPRERSIEVVRDAVLQRRGAPLFDLLAAAAAGVPLRDWRGGRLDADAVAPILVGQVASLLQQLLYLQRVAADMAHEMDPERTRSSRWYQRTFKDGLAPELKRRIEGDQGSPIARSGKGLSPWSLSRLFAAAGNYRQGELIAFLAAAGAVEADTRGSFGLAAVSAWLMPLLGPAR